MQAPYVLALALLGLLVGLIIGINLPEEKVTPSLLLIRNNINAIPWDSTYTGVSRIEGILKRPGDTAEVRVIFRTLTDTVYVRGGVTP